MLSDVAPRHAPWSPELASATIDVHAADRGPLLPVLLALQETFGYVDPRAVPLVAKALNISRADVHGVLTFYPALHSTPPGNVRVQVCRGEACQSVGAHVLAEQATSSLGVDFGGTTSDGSVTLDEVFCLGNCALGPTVTVNRRLHGRVHPSELETLVRATRDSPTAHTPNAANATTVDSATSGATTDSPTTDSPATNGPATDGWVTVFVPRDSSARSVGADRVVAAIELQAAGRGAAVKIVRNGSRGLMWLEPLVEVVTSSGRVAYGPVSADDVAGLFDAGFLDAGAHPLGHGRTEQIPWLAGQDRLTFSRVGVIDPLSARDYEAHGGLTALRRALAMAPEQICDEVTSSGLRGRGGAGFPVGVKWRTVLDAPAYPKFVTCNADEGDSGTFADRMLMEGDPFMLIEGMVIAGIATGAHEGFIYIRSEYPDAVATMRAAIGTAYEAGWLGPGVLGSDHGFDLEIRVGAGAYICGEETAMLESLEGLRGVVRAKPPLPAIEGLFGRPTVVNNVLSLASVLVVLARGADFYRDFGVGRSRGTQVFQLAGNVARGGIVETAFGITLGQMLEQYGGGTASGRPIRAVQVGGPLGAYLPPSSFDLPLDYEAFAEAGAMVGHGGIVVFDDTADLAAQARFAMEFCAAESCGKCTPCRVGAVRGVEVIDRIVAGQERAANLVLLQDLCEVMADGSLCALGGLTPMPVRSVLRHFPESLGGSADQPLGTRT